MGIQRVTELGVFRRLRLAAAIYPNTFDRGKDLHRCFNDVQPVASFRMGGKGSPQAGTWPRESIGQWEC